MDNKKPRIKIFYCITALGIGGAERLLYLHLKYLDRDRFDPSVIAIVHDGVFGEKIRRLGIDVRCLDKSTTLGLGTLLRLWKIFRQEKPDIVHTHLFGGDTWGRIPAILARIPVILTTEHLMNVDERGLKRWVKRGLGHWTDRVVGVSDAVVNFSAKVDRIPFSKLQRVYGPVECEKFAEVLPLTSLKHRLALIGRMEERKGHETFFQACASLLSDVPDLRIRVIYSGGEREWENKMKRRVVELDLDDRVEWIKDRFVLCPILEQTDLVIVPSYFEGLGLVAIEAMAAGRMVIASGVGGLKEIITNGKNGLLVPPKDPQALAKAIRYCFDHPEKTVEIGALARLTAMNNFSVQSFVRNYDKIYHELLESKGIKIL